MTGPAPQSQSAGAQSQSQPAAAPSQGRSAAATSQGAAAPAAQSQAQGQSQAQAQSPASASGGATGARVRRLTGSTPRMLRLLRAATAAAALVTGLVTAGGVSTDGAVGGAAGTASERWAAAERASVDIAHVGQLAAERVTQGDRDETVRADYDAALTSVTVDLGRIGSAPGHSRHDSQRLAEDWAAFSTGAERAATLSRSADGIDVGALPETVAQVYDPAVSSGQQAAWTAGQVADELTETVGLGAGSTLAVVIGSIATLLLLGALVWVALRTRRIVNIPLLIATLITAGLTYSAANPTFLPGEVGARMDDGSQAASALQAVYQARAAQYTLAPGQDENWSEMISRADGAVGRFQGVNLSNELGTLREQGSAVASGDTSPADGLSASEEAFRTMETTLRERTDDLLTADGISLPATLTNGAAVLLGLAAAVLAWSGLGRRLKDYR